MLRLEARGGSWWTDPADPRPGRGRFGGVFCAGAVRTDAHHSAVTRHVLGWRDFVFWGARERVAFVTAESAQVIFQACVWQVSQEWHTGV